MGWAGRQAEKGLLVKISITNENYSTCLIALALVIKVKRVLCGGALRLLRLENCHNGIEVSAELPSLGKCQLFRTNDRNIYFAQLSDY